jgi:hypothetical protein
MSGNERQVMECKIQVRGMKDEDKQPTGYIENEQKPLRAREKGGRNGVGKGQSPDMDRTPGWLRCYK